MPFTRTVPVIPTIPVIHQNLASGYKLLSRKKVSIASCRKIPTGSIWTDANAIGRRREADKLQTQEAANMAATTSRFLQVPIGKELEALSKDPWLLTHHLQPPPMTRTKAVLAARTKSPTSHAGYFDEVPNQETEMLLQVIDSHPTMDDVQRAEELVDESYSQWEATHILQSPATLTRTSIAASNMAASERDFGFDDVTGPEKPIDVLKRGDWPNGLDEPAQMNQGPVIPSSRVWQSSPGQAIRNSPMITMYAGDTPVTTILV